MENHHGGQNGPEYNNLQEQAAGYSLEQYRKKNLFTPTATKKEYEENDIANDINYCMPLSHRYADLNQDPTLSLGFLNSSTSLIY